jgi:hypothetical protein
MTHEDIEATKAPLMEHLIELRSRLIKALIAFGIAFIGCFFFAKTIYNVLTWPFVWVAGPENSKFIYTGLLEYFVVQLKLAMFGAAFISFPIVATQLYMFVAPGLYRHERQAFLPYLVATPIFFFLGSLVVYFLVWPMLARRLPQLDDEADLRLRDRFPAAGDPDPARPRRYHHFRPAQGQAALFHRRRFRDCRNPDPTRCAQPAVARSAANAALRGLDLVGSICGEEGSGRQSQGRGERCRQAGGMSLA